MVVIYSAQDNQQQILMDIAQLHNGGSPFDADLFYGNGSFWSGVAEPLRPKIRMDLSPAWKRIKGDKDSESTEVNLQADVRALPFRSESLLSICSDPPFIHAAGASSVMGQRFGSYPSQRLLLQMYWRAMMEIQRVLVPGGLLVWKTQDIVESGRQKWNHVDIMMNAQTCGMPCIDLFVLVRGSTIAGHNHTRQQHARKNHSYFLVCRKDRRSYE